MNTTRIKQLAVALMAALSVSPLHGQSVGDRLRVKTTDGRKLQGAVLSVEPNGLQLQRDRGGPVLVERAEIKKLEKRVGKKTLMWPGFFVGTATGALIGFALVGIMEAVPASAGGMGTGTNPLVGALVGAIVPGMIPLGIIGGGIGRLIKTGDKWKTISLSQAGISSQTGSATDLLHVVGMTIWF